MEANPVHERVPDIRQMRHGRVCPLVVRLSDRQLKILACFAAVYGGRAGEFLQSFDEGREERSSVSVVRGPLYWLKASEEVGLPLAIETGE
jgi:hypothetical protein